MYYRIKNLIDAEILTEDFPKENQIGGDRIKEIAGVLDDNYGRSRNSISYGGYVLYFPTEDAYRNQAQKVLDFYHMDGSMCEYTETIGERPINGIKWQEELFLLSSDDSLVLIHPVEVANV